MGGSSKKVTVGYRYFLGWHAVLCQKVDRLLQIKVDDKEAWTGEAIDEQITINRPGLFGGEKREGGVSGSIDVLSGSPTQQKNDYLQSQLGQDIPAFRRVFSLVFRRMYVGMNPYLKKWRFKVSRIHRRADNSLQWYDEKAEINNTTPPPPEIQTQFSPTSDGWKYLQVALNDDTDYSSPAFDDSSWSDGQFPFGDAANHPFIGTFPNVINTTWQKNTNLWVRRNFTVEDPNKNIRLEVFADNWVTVWINGQVILQRSGTGETASTEAFTHVIEIPSVYIQESNSIAILAEDIEEVFESNRTNLSIRPYTPPNPQYDMNPTHILREVITEPWGLRKPESDVDEPDFIAAADKLYAEEMGISIMKTEQTPTEEFITEIARHIDATVFIDQQTGKYRIKLIRDDYDVESLLVLDDSNILKVSDYSVNAPENGINSVTVVYRDPIKDKNAAVTVDDLGLIQAAGRVINTTIQYPGFTNAFVATRAAQRDLKALSQPLLKCKIEANREASLLTEGDVFKFVKPDYHDGYVIMRVMRMEYGDGRFNVVRVTATEDIYSLPEALLVEDEESGWTDITQAPKAVSKQIAFEVPYLEIVQSFGQDYIDDVLSKRPETGYFGMAAEKPDDSSINSNMWTDSGAGYTEATALDFSPTLIMAQDIGRTETVFQVSGEIEVEAGTWLQVGNELMSFVSYAEPNLTVKRGVLDTVPQPHVTGETLYFWDSFGAADSTEYINGETVTGKLLTVSTGGELDINDAPESSVTFDARAIRPYPPGNFSINAVSFPDFIEGQAALTWAHRDRTQQTGAVLIGYTEGSISPETGTTYSIELYGETGTLDRQYDGLTGTTQTWDTETTDSGAYRSNGQISLYEPFYTSLPDGFATFYAAGGTPAAEFHPSTGGVRLIAGNFLTYWRLDSQPDLYSGEFEIDIEPYTDCGLWLAGVNGAGYRFAYDGAWSALRYNGYTETVSLGTAITSPVITSGVRYKFMVVWDADTGGMQFYVDGVKVFDVTDKTYKRLRPAVYLFGGDVIVHEVRLLARRTIDRLNNTIRVKAYSVVEGRSSWQPVDFETTRVGYGYSYGLYYGDL